MRRPTAEGLLRAFRQAVDDCLAHREEHGTPAERPLEGSFNIRTGPDRHRQAVARSGSRQRGDAGLAPST
jgi:predicted HicB family RNase H-like nuclease